jgi:hypothetical protein
VKPGCLQRRYPKALVNITAENNPNIMRPISIETTHSPSRPGKKQPQSCTDGDRLYVGKEINEAAGVAISLM